MAKDKMSFEKSMERLEAIVKQLERGEAPLSESLALFEEGTALISACGKLLDEAEQKVVMLKKGENGEPQELPFEGGEQYMLSTYEAYRALAENEIEKTFAGGAELPQHRLLEAMRYSLLAGGKRIRPVLVLAFCEATGGQPEKALPVAAAIEMLHTYSLIHDDLPCMDNDELRRGMPTNHVVFGEFTATLAGDALQAEAFGTILRSKLPAEIRADCAEALANAAGVDGICGGQQLDMEGNGKTLSEQELTELQSRKTGSLLAAACLMGAIVGGATEKQREAALIYGSALGAAFQIRDDMLDELSTEEELGKPIGSDRRECKATFMSLYGREECARRVAALTDYAKNTVREAFPEPEFLMEFADELSRRRS